MTATSPDPSNTLDVETYGRTFDVPIHFSTAVRRLTRRDDGVFTATTGNGTIHTRQVVVATGPFQAPLIPALAAGLTDSVVQLHSAAYQRPHDLPDGRVVVGAGYSGLQIALELAAAGRDVSANMRNPAPPCGPYCTIDPRIGAATRPSRAPDTCAAKGNQR